MAHDNNSGARAEPGLRFHGFDLWWHRAIDGLAVLGTVSIGLLMLVICSDIVARNFFGASLPMISELGALTLVTIVYLQLATTVRADRLAKTELFLAGFSRRMPRAGAMLSALYGLIGAILTALIAWSTWLILQKDYASGEFIGIPGVATLVTWPFRILILLGAAAATIEFLIRAVAAMRVGVSGASSWTR